MLSNITILHISKNQNLILLLSVSNIKLLSMFDFLEYFRSYFPKQKKRGLYPLMAQNYSLVQ